MRRNPERIAWTVLCAATAVFCLLVVGTPLAIRSFLLSATDDQDTRLQVIEGTVLVEKAGRDDPIGVTQSADLSPGDEVITDQASWATLDLFDRSHVILYSSSRIELDRVQVPRFGVSDRPNRITLSLTGGLMRVGVSMPDRRPCEFRVVTPHSTIDLEEGSYRIEVTNQGSLVTVVRGQAVVGRGQTTAQIPQGSRTWVDLSGIPAAPLPATRNLIENGDFQQPLATGWETDTVAFAPSVQRPKIEIKEDGGRRAARFVRREGDAGNHTEAIIRQKLDQNVRDFSRLEIALDVRLDFQSLSGGGMLSSEFPIIIRLDYKDRWGTDKFWTHGFYYQNQSNFPIGPDPWGRPSGESVPRNVWYPYESGNLLELLGDNQPAQLTRLAIYASGWNYDGLVSEIQLMVE